MKFRFEQLEARLNCSGFDCTFCDIFPAGPGWENGGDGNAGEWGDGNITPGDVLFNINRLNSKGPGAVPATEIGDVNFDGMFNQFDILRQINWLNNCQDQASTILKIGLADDAQTFGLTVEQTRAAIISGIRRIGDVADVGFEFTALGTAGNHTNITLRTVHVGGGLHAGGIYQRGQIGIHNGRIPGGTHACRNGRPCGEAFWHQVFQFDGLQNVAQHEVMHSFGFGHLPVSPPRLMSPGATTPVMSPGTVAALLRQFGPGAIVEPSNLDAIDLLFTI
jgi:hypothetical protein